MLACSYLIHQNIGLDGIIGECGILVKIAGSAKCYNGETLMIIPVTFKFLLSPIVETKEV
jgi:hypothetical protein